jgi:hypothetical protein
MSNSKTNSGREVVTALIDLHCAEVKAYQAYSRLETSGRNEVENLLLRHAFLLGGRDSYVDWGRWNEIERWWSWKLLRDKASEEMANAWHDWAFEISKMPMSELARRDAILKMVRKFVILKFLEAPLPGRVKRLPKKNSLQPLGEL